MSDTHVLQRWRVIVLKLFPWMARFVLSPSGALAIKSAAARIELEGGGPAVGRVGDSCGYLYAQTLSGVLVAVYYSATAPPAALWAPVVMSTAPPTALTAGTPIAIQTGSSKVTCG